MGRNEQKRLNKWLRWQPYSKQRDIELSQIKDRRDTMRYLANYLQLNANKLLDVRMTGRRYVYRERTRGEGPSRWLETILKGNYIVCRELFYEHQEPFGYHMVEIFRVPIKQPKRYLDRYREETPDCGW